ncbi:MAG TPA: 50S ribosomal protein L25 [Candidatus Saccharimonadales bacterium]|nr:50S ribosomal protein L25 [Candidatus Saccharimonadales bacterium]
MSRPELNVEERSLTGKKVKKLRREGVIPANIFGKDVKSISVQVAFKDFQKTFKEAGETALIDVKVKNEVYPSLIHNLQRDPVHDDLIHVDFHKVNLKEKITTAVPVVLVGESPIAKSGEGLLLQTLNEVEVECLPTDIPSSIEVDAEKLTEVGQAVHVKDLKVEKDKVEITNDPEEVVVTVQTAEMKEEEPEPEVSPEDVEATAEKAEGEEGGEKEPIGEEVNQSSEGSKAGPPEG